MTRHIGHRYVFYSLIIIFSTALLTQAQVKPGRDPNQPIDEDYTKKIREYTTETYFNSPLTDYLPASPNVPTPKAVLGDVAGAPGKVAYAEEVYRYMRVVEKARPRGEGFFICTTQERRGKIAGGVASCNLMAQMGEK